MRGAQAPQDHPKKTLSHPKADAQGRGEFQARLEALRAEGRPVVFVDESGFAQDAPRPHGYAPSGEHCPGQRDWHARGRADAIGALLGGALLTVSLLTGLANAGMFHLRVAG